VKKEKARAEVINYWMEKAHEALESAMSEQNSDMKICEKAISY